ncbi:MAG: DUF308 domain-containing protein [Clostridia bacterium]
MPEFLRKIGHFILLRAFAFISLGLLLLLLPSTTLTAIIYLIGSYFAIEGIVSLVAYFKTKKEPNANGFYLPFAIGQILIALFFFFFTTTIAGFLPIIIGIIIVAISSVNISQALAVRKLSGNDWLLSLGLSVLTAAAGIFVIFFSYSISIALTIIIGVLLVIQGVSDIVGYFTYKNYPK